MAKLLVAPSPAVLLSGITSVGGYRVLIFSLIYFLFYFFFLFVCLYIYIVSISLILGFLMRVKSGDFSQVGFFLDMA